MPRKYSDADFVAAFWAKTRVDGECLIWTGQMSAHTQEHGGPRPLVKKHRKRMYAHRVSLEMKLGRPIAKGLQANHTCDRNACVAWDHLYEGTQAQNVEDRESRGRGNHARGTAVYGAKLNEAKVREIRELLDLGVIHQDIADQYGVSDQLISRIKSGSIWRHVSV